MASAFPTTSTEPDPLAPRFRQWREQGRVALIPYLTAGYPAAAQTPALLSALADAGADVIELGVPFSDPVADGPTIQRASQIALDNGTTLARVLEQLSAFRARQTTPVVLFSYLNPVLSYGVEPFVADAAAAGAQGVLITDLPLGADPELEQLLEQSPLALVRLVAPTTPPERARLIAARAQGFVYYVARMGVTGAGATIRAELAAELEQLRAASPVPVAAGFGISTPEHARALRSHADGLVVGSALIDALDGGGEQAAESLLRSLRTALDTGS